MSGAKKGVGFNGTAVNQSVISVVAWYCLLRDPFVSYDLLIL